VVVEGALVVVGNLAVGLIGEEAVGELEQVVRAAVLTVVAREVFRLRLGLEEMLLVGDLACDEGMIINKRIK